MQDLRSPLVFNMARCLLCRTTGDTLEAKFKPPTAGLRILSIDGGGSRVIVSLILFTALMKSAQLSPKDIKYAFDILGGTSAGECPSFHMQRRTLTSVHPRRNHGRITRD